MEEAASKYESDPGKVLKEKRKISGITWTGFRQATCYTGHLPITLGSISYQKEGSKLMAVVDVSEAIEGWMKDTKDENGKDLVRPDAADLLKDMARGVTIQNVFF